MQSQTSHNGQIRGSGSGGKPNPAEPNRYFYHPDHLGSTSYITDATGEVYQHLEYFAFGETFVEEHSNTDRTPYLYNGKELDEETGLYYYRARYYDAQTSVWLGVDRYAEKYPGLTPYHYTANNPVKYVDVNGDTLRLGQYIMWNNFWEDTHPGREFMEVAGSITNFFSDIGDVVSGDYGIIILGTGEYPGNIELGEDRSAAHIEVLDLGNPENVLSALNLTRSGGKDKDALGNLIEFFGEDHPAFSIKYTQYRYDYFKITDRYTDKDGNELVYSPFEKKQNFYRLEVYRNSDGDITGYGYTKMTKDELVEIE